MGFDVKFQRNRVKCFSFCSNTKKQKCSENRMIWLNLIIWHVDPVLYHWNHIWLHHYRTKTKDFKKRISPGCARHFPSEAIKHKPFRSHSGLSSVVAAKGFDSVRPFSSQAEQDFSPHSRGYSSGKIPAGHNKIYLLNVFEWIQSPQRGCHRSLAAAACWRKECVKRHCCLGIPPRQRCWIMVLWEFGANVFKSATDLSLLFFLP